MKNLLFLAQLFLILQFACNKTENIMSNENRQFTQRSDTISEVYVYDDITYTLYFDAEGESGDPLNTDVEDELIDAIGSNDYIIVHKYESGDTIFLGNIADTLDPDTASLAAIMSPASLATYYQNINFGGFSMDLTNGYPTQRVIFNQTTCSDEYIHPNLISMNMTGYISWNDQISSFKMHQSGAAKAFYDANGWSGNGAKIQFVLFRDSPLYNYIPSGCYIEIWEMRTDYGTQDADWTVSNLTNKRWGFLCARMNDNVSAVSARVCKKNNSCVGNCLRYVDPL